tara:strand:- start:503 stop:712 length:210 start_codon:yes stop_codon:yes gene_type:complete
MVPILNLIRPHEYEKLWQLADLGSPRGPTDLRTVIELIEELVHRGGGLELFTGCAAGDTAMATVIRVSD